MDATDASNAAAIANANPEQIRAMEKEYSRSSDEDKISSSPDEEERDKEVADLARKFTRESSISSDLNPFEAEKDSILDPFSPNFRPRAFTKSILHLQSRNPEKWPKRTAGFCFSNLNVYGFGSATDFQSTVGSIFLKTLGYARKVLGIGQRRIDILRNLDGLVREGELLVVLGPPGSGCSTFLKTIAGETHGFFLDTGSNINYQGIESKQMHKDFRGEAIYTAEVDVHFPQLTVGQTLEFAAAARTPRHIPGNVSPERYARLMRDVTMATLGISHTVDTRVGNEFIRGVSGGERKRVTIAEAALCGAPLQCWDNSTRGLDSANAIEFCKTIRMGTELVGATACVAIYQASQTAYDIFDKALVLYQGRQIYFGATNKAKDYFIRLGFECEDRQTTADFLTSMTSPSERLVRSGFEGRVPRTPDDFAEAWLKSPEREKLLEEMNEYNKVHLPHGEYLEKFKASRRAQQAKIQRVSSPYTLSYHGQVLLCLRRGFWRLRGDPSLTFTQLFGNSIMALIVGSIFYNLPSTTESFYARGALLFFAGLLNAFGSALEILTLYAQRPIVEKHSRYAFYHPSCEAFASMLTDMPYKIGNAIFFNLALYFLTDLRRTVPAFFIFFLVSFTLTLTMSMLFRTIASMSRSLSEAMTPAAIVMLGIIIYTGFALPIPYMRGWARWINYVNPVAYAFESLMINEFWGRSFQCAAFVPEGPGYNNTTGTQRVCSAVGAKPGLSVVSGSDYINAAFQYEYSHLWRNYGILLVFMVGLCAVYLLATEFITAKKSKGEVLLFRRGHAPTPMTKKTSDDVESVVTRTRSSSLPNLNQVHSAHLEQMTAIFHWKNVCFDIPVKGGNKAILDNVDGWIKPGTLTALMGVSGAGKTTLLDCLADRATIGVITGDIMVDGRQRDDSFTRSTGYVQQLDLHLSTTTVREALTFSALLRQPARIPKAEKLAYVDEVIKMLEMEEWVDAIVGVPGEGLNVEQRKRLTIGVELAAKPQLLLFFDEPTSGLDSQTSWAICDLMEKLVQSGQAVLCTIHQPSAILFQRFDRLLFLAAGGKTVYFGDIGQNSSILTQYFERNGAPACPPNANPAEWMLEITGAAPGSHTDIDWQHVWRTSPEYAEIHRELDRLAGELPQITQPVFDPEDKTTQREFAADFNVQLVEVTKRVFQQYWRTPSYIYSKVSLCILAGLFIGFSFYNMPNSQQGLINQMFSIFLLFTIFGQLVQQIMPHFVTQRALYEARERPSKTYSWKAFMLANIVVELPYNTAMGVVLFFTVYYPIGLYKNAEATDTVNERGALFFLLLLQFMLFTSTFTNMVIAAIETAEEGGNIANLMFSLTLIFNGVLAPPGKFPEFWIFMYRLSPFTYLVSALLSTGLANTDVVCSPTELLHFQSPPNMTCGQYMETYRSQYGGYLEDPSVSSCSFCPLSSTNQFLVSISSSYETRWRNFGIMFVFIGFNVIAAVFLYWLVRVPKKKSRKAKTE